VPGTIVYNSSTFVIGYINLYFVEIDSKTRTKKKEIYPLAPLKVGWALKNAHPLLRALPIISTPYNYVNLHQMGIIRHCEFDRLLLTVEFVAYFKFTF